MIKNLLQKTIIMAVVIVLLSSILIPVRANADVTGKLIRPLCDLALAVGDAGQYLMQHFMIGNAEVSWSLFFKSYKEDDIMRSYHEIEGKTMQQEIDEVGKNGGLWGAIDDWLSNFLKIIRNGMIAKDAETDAQNLENNKIDSYFVKVPNEESADIIIEGAVLDYSIKYPTFMYSPEEIFKGNVPLLSIDFFSTFTINDLRKSEEDSVAQLLARYIQKAMENRRSPAFVLRKTIAGWYVALRNICAAFMLCVLVYTGIIILTSTSSQKVEKYKSHLIDWVVGMCLLFFLQYFMVFCVQGSQALVKLFTTTGTDTISIEIVRPKMGHYDAVYAREAYIANKTLDDSYNFKFNTNYIGATRFLAQSSATSESITAKISFTIIYLVMVGFTFMFTIKYLKRVIMMAVLTMIAPLVALMYPIDKLGDGKAQSFSLWTKEYVYHCLIQPFHLLIYSVIIMAASNLTHNLIYVITALFFLMPAERFFKNMFGFNQPHYEVEDPSIKAAMGAIIGSLAGNKKKDTEEEVEEEEEEIEEKKGKVRVIDAGPEAPNVVVKNKTTKVEKKITPPPQSNPATFGMNQEAYDEIIAEGFEPGTEEFDMVARSYAGYNGKGGPELIEESPEQLPEVTQRLIETEVEPNREEVKNNYKKSLKNFYQKHGKTIIRGVARTSVIVAGGAAGTAVGLMVAAARGSKPIEEMTVGAGAGAGLGKAVFDKLASAKDNFEKTIKEEKRKMVNEIDSEILEESQRDIENDLRNSRDSENENNN